MKTIYNENKRASFVYWSRRDPIFDIDENEIKSEFTFTSSGIDDN